MTSPDHADHDEFVPNCPFCEAERERPEVPEEDIEAIAGMGVRFSDEP